MIPATARLSIATLFRTFPFRIAITWTLTLIETTMFALLPLLIGRSIDGLLDDDWTAFYQLLGALGGPRETRHDGHAADWAHATPDLPTFHTLAIHVKGQPDRILPRTGLPDDAFQHDGKLTKQAMRTITLAHLAPHRGAVLWDIGLGCGSVAIEWMRAARYARAIGIEPRADRRAMAAENALALGAPKLDLIDGKVPQALENLDAPDAVFIGGGLSEDTFKAAWHALRPLGRLVANAVTLESEAQLIALHKAHGGDLVRLQTHRADPVGAYTGWRPSMPVTQWSLIKR